MSMSVNNNTLTSGPLWRSISQLAAPMMASALLQNLQSVVDLFWVGELGQDAVAALAVSGTVLMMLFPVVMGLSTGTVAVVSRCVGAGAFDEAAEAGGQSLLLALTFGVVAGGLGWAVAGPLCGLLGAEGPVARLGEQYLQVTFLGSLTMFALFMGNSILMASGNTVLPMYAMLLANGVNLALDPVLIFGWFGLPRLEVAGAAGATVISQLVAAGVVIWALVRGKSGLRLGRAAWRVRPSVAWRVMRLGIPSSGQMFSRSAMGAVLMRVVAGFGTSAVAAYGIGLRIHMVVLLPAFALGNAAATLVGQNLGAGQARRAGRAAWLATALDGVIMAASAGVLMIGAEPVMRIFNAHEDVVRMGAAYLRITSAFHVFAALSIVLGRALQGAGDTVSPMVATVVGLWGLQVPLALVLPSWFTPPTDGIWWAIAVALTANGAMVVGWFCTGRWKRRKV